MRIELHLYQEKNNHFTNTFFLLAMNKRILTIGLAGIMGTMYVSALTPLWLRDAKISPDGKTIAFTYKGQIWTVPSQGGTARQITTGDSYNSTPIWSPDSKQLAFASDRNGGNDIFLTGAAGGQAKRLTYNSASEIPEAFAPDGKYIYYSAALQDPVSSALFPTSRMTELYRIPVSGGSSEQILATPAQHINFVNGDAGKFVYQDQKGFEDEWRKHHTSSVTRDLWLYDTASGKHTNLTSRPGEDRDPVVSGDTLFYLAEKDGKSMNLYYAPITDTSESKRLSDFAKHPVRFLSRANNGTLCYTYDGEIYTQTVKGKPAKVKIDIVDDMTEQPRRLSVRPGRNIIPSPDGKFVAYTSRGDVFVSTVDYATTKQITNTPQAEHGVSWSKDGKALYYGSERNGLTNIYKATLANESDPDFANATVIKEEQMFSDDGTERNYPDISPDGKKMAFIADRNKLMVMDLKNKKVTQLTDGKFYPSQSGGFDFVWSPDSKWIAFEVIDKQHDPYSDLAVINIDTKKVTNVTNTGYFAENPKWVLDGNALMYITDRYGLRNHASWGSQSDVMLVFFNQDAYDKFMMNEEDYAIAEDAEKKAKSEADKDKKDKNNDKDKQAKNDEKAEADKALELDFNDLDNRLVRLTPMSSMLSDAYITPDGKTLYYLISAPDGTQLWKKALRKDDHRMLAKASGSSRIVATPDGKVAFLSGSSVKKLDTKSDKITPLTASGSMLLDAAAERDFMFDYVAREEGHRFYNKNMHGVDWKGLTAHYKRFMPHISNNYDFAELLSEMLGELNVSHTGGRYGAPTSSSAQRTASLGLIYDLHYTGDGLKVDEVVKGSPFSNGKSELRKGMIITSVNGKEIKAGQNNDILFNDIAGKKTLVEFRNPADNKTYKEVVKPISAGKFNTLLYNRWVENRAADVDRMSNGRLGYVHIQSMGDPSFRSMYSDVLGKYNDREGIVIDVRWNGGGRLHEDIEVMFTGEKYLTQEIRGVDACDMPSRRWNKPSIMVMCEACYSNAHGTPWVYKHKNIGKLVGAPVPGTMTSVNWVTMQDPSMVFGIPVIGYRTAEGTYLENSQLEPDILIYNDPAEIVNGHDAQLEAAVKTLLDEIDSAKNK